jgi:hypothetical protein
LHGQAGVERIFELPLGCRPARQLAGEGQPADRRHQHRLNAVTDRHLQRAVRVLELGEVDDGFPLPAHVDERDLGTNRHDPAFEGLAVLEPLRLQRSLEHRGEIFVRFAHLALLIK